MIVRGRWKGAVIMSLLWAAAIGVTLYFLSFSNSAKLLVPLFVSLFLMMIGLAVYMGGAMLLAGFNTMTKEEQAQLNVNELTSFTGAFLVLMSYIAFIVHYLNNDTNSL